MTKTDALRFVEQYILLCRKHNIIFVQEDGLLPAELASLSELLAEKGLTFPEEIYADTVYPDLEGMRFVFDERLGK